MAAVVNVLSLSAVSGHTGIQSQGVVFNMYRFLKAEGESGPGENGYKEGCLSHVAYRSALCSTFSRSRQECEKAKVSDLC